MKKISMVIVFVLCVSILSGCNKEQEQTKAPNDGEYQLYFLNAEENGLYSRNVKIDKNQTLDKQIKDVMQKLTETANYTQYKSVLPGDLTIVNLKRKEKIVTIDYSPAYYELDNVLKLLSKAAIVKSLTQIKGIDKVQFTVEEQSIMEDETVVGPLSGEMFVDNTDENAPEKIQEFSLYYTNKEGTVLKVSKSNINTSGDRSPEQLVIEKLISAKAPEGCYNTLPKGTKLNSISTKDGICYIDLSEEFLKPEESVKDYVTIYSVVDTLCELANVSKVKFTIDGKEKSYYNQTIPFSQMFERNLDIVKGEE